MPDLEINSETIKTQKILPCGYLRVLGFDYFLIKPYPLNPDWEREGCRFEVVPIHKDSLGLYPCPRHVIIDTFTAKIKEYLNFETDGRVSIERHGGYVIEYDTLEPIICHVPWL